MLDTNFQRLRSRNMWSWFKGQKEIGPPAGEPPASSTVHQPVALGELPESIVAVDVETTGLHSNDRIVSLGAVWIPTHCLSEPSFPISYIHLIFDPLKKSHPEAEAVHGYDDWLLRHQEPFWMYARQIRRFIYSGKLIVAHNAEFDLEFLNREMVLAGEPERISRPAFCTMREYRRRYGSPASLQAACASVGLHRATSRHDALEDAWLAAMIYLRLHGHDCARPLQQTVKHTEVFNMGVCPPRPAILPRRNNASKKMPLAQSG